MHVPVVFTVQHRTNLCNVVVHGFVLRSLIGSSSQLCDTIPTAPKRGCGGIIRPSICLPFTTGWLHPRFPIRLGLTDPHGFKYANANGFFSRSFPPVTVQRPPQPDDQRNAKNPQSLARHRCAQRFPFRSPSSLQRVDAVPRCFFFFILNSNERTNERTNLKPQEPRVVLAWRSRRTFSLAVTMLSPRGDLPRSFTISYRTLPSIKRGCACWRST